MEQADLIGLTEKQQKFVLEYLLNGGNATKAAIKAGYSKKTADQIGSELLQKTRVKEAISKHRKKRVEEFEISEKRIIQELAAIGFFDLGEVLTWDKNGVVPFKSSELDERFRRAIQSISEHRTESGDLSFSVKGHDKIQALKLMGQHIGMFKDGRTPVDSGDRSALYRRLSTYLRKRKVGE